MKKAYEFNEEFEKHFYARKCLLRLFRFTVKYLDGDLNNLKDFDFFKMKEENDEEFACKEIKSQDKTEIDPDNFEIVNDIYYILWHDKLPELKRTEIGSNKKYRGDTINTYATLFKKEGLRNEDLIPLEIRKEVIGFQKKYLTIGNFYLLPELKVENKSINQFRGVDFTWRDYFPKFLEELGKVLSNSPDKDARLKNLVVANSFYFDKVKTVEDFMDLNFLSGFDDKEKTKKIEKRYCHWNDENKSDYIQFAKDYIEIATEIIDSRAEKMVSELKNKISQSRSVVLPPNILYNIKRSREKTLKQVQGDIRQFGVTSQFGMTTRSVQMPKTKSNDKNSLVIYRRILRLDELFSAETYPSLQDLLEDEQVGASRTTIFRTIEFMRDQLHAPIVFDKVNGGYCYSEKAFRLPSVFTTEQELFAVTLMKDMASKLKGTPLYESASSILDFMRKNTVKNPNDWEFSNDHEPREDSKTEWIENRFIFLNQEDFTVDNKVWENLSRAIRANKQVEFEYNWEKEKQWVKIFFEPYQVVNSNGRWYVYGFDVSIKERRLFLLDMIRDVKIVPREFSLPKDFDFRNFSSGIFGAFQGKTEYNFKAKFSGWAIPYIKRGAFGKNQKIENGEGDEVILSFTGTELLPFLNMILSYGKYAVPLEPEELVDMWKEEVREMNAILK